eukprot:scaffold233_cov174-Ochromonas_danica.AAC.57
MRGKAIIVVAEGCRCVAMQQNCRNNEMRNIVFYIAIFILCHSEAFRRPFLLARKSTSLAFFAQRPTGGDIFHEITSLQNLQNRRIKTILLQSLLFGVTLTTSQYASAETPISPTPIPTPSTTSTSEPLLDISGSVRKRVLDDRQYKAITLKNGLRVLLVSDPESKRAAAAVDVHVGSFSDPVNLPGLAHFCEHMTFLGTKKFPDEDEFTNYLASHSGENALDGALDRFAQFFIAPLYTDDAVEREINAIDSEHKKNINSNTFRTYQLEYDGANPAHPLNRFTTGTKDTLYTLPLQRGEDPVQALKDFFQRYYSASLMTLCLYSNHNLADLEDLARRSFSNVPIRSQKNDPALAYLGKVIPFYEKDDALLLEIVPVGERRSLTLSWPIWISNLTYAKVLQDYKPEAILTDLLGHETKGSLRSLLVEKKLVNSLSAFVSTETTDLHVFTISMDLTESGLTQYQEIISHIFAYIDLMRQEMIRKGDLPDYLIQEYTQQSMISFAFGEKGEPVDSVSTWVANMQRYNSSEYVTGGRIFERYDRNVLFNYLNHLSPQRLRIILTSNTLANHTMEVESYYGTHYNNRTLPLETTKWQRVRAEDFPGCFVDHINEYLYNAHLAGLDWEIEFTSKGLQCIVNGFHDNFHIFLEEIMNSLSTFKANPEDFKRHYDIVQRDLEGWRTQQPYSHAAYYSHLALETLNFQIESLQNSLKRVQLEDINRFLPRILKRSFGDALVMGNIDQERALALIDVIDRALPFQPLDNEKRSNRELGLLPITSLPLLQGQESANLNKANTVVVDSDGVVKSVSNEVVGAKEVVAGYRLHHPEPNANDDNSAVTFYFQLPAIHPNVYVYLELLHDILEQPFYSSLRTQQQLGYIVYSGLSPKDCLHSLTFTVQSPVLPVEKLTARIHAFLRDIVENMLNDLTEEQLEEYKSSLIIRKSEQPRSLSREASEIWSELLLAIGYTNKRLAVVESVIRSPSYREVFGEQNSLAFPLFNRPKAEAEAVKGVTLEKLQRFVREFIGENGSLRRLLVSEIASQKPPSMTAVTGSYDVEEEDDEQDEEERGALATGEEIEVDLPLQQIDKETASMLINGYNGRNNNLHCLVECDVVSHPCSVWVGMQGREPFGSEVKVPMAGCCASNASRVCVGVVSVPANRRPKRRRHGGMATEQQIFNDHNERLLSKDK